MGRGRVFSREFKLAMVRQATSGEKRPAPVCREHGIGEGLLRWRREYEAWGEAAFAPHQPSETETLKRKVAELERPCGQLALENAVLKGALTGSDAWSRRCVGWHLSRSIDRRLTLVALDPALVARQPPPGLIHHSDRGVQYASGDYVARPEGIGAKFSMAAVGNPYENAKAESFFKTLKWEEVYQHDYRTFDEAEANLARFIDDVYNTKRLHSSLGYLPPVEVEAAGSRATRPQPLGAPRGAGYFAPDAEPL